MTTEANRLARSLILADGLADDSFWVTLSPGKIAGCDSVIDVDGRPFRVIGHRDGRTLLEPYDDSVYDS